MGCGVSQISPLDRSISASPSGHRLSPKPWNNLQIFLTGRQISHTGSSPKTSLISRSVQTEDDIFGFKCQLSQTDSSVMSDVEFEAMILILQESELDENRPETPDAEEYEEDEEEHEKLLNSSRNGLRSRLAIVHVAVQATLVTREKSTQTKFGSIDYRFDEPDAKANPEVIDKLLDLINETEQMPVETLEVMGKVQRVVSAKTRLKDIGKRLRQNKQDSQLQICLASIMGEVRAPKQRDVQLQTVNDILTDESPLYTARPPLRLKHELIASVALFRELDRKVQQFPEVTSVAELVRLITSTAKNELFRVRAIFTWITSSIRHTKSLEPSNRISAEILQSREGNSREFASLFSDICRLVGLRVKVLQGFVRGPSHPPTFTFDAGRSTLEYWNAVFVASSWRAVDCYLGAGQLNPSNEEFEVKRNELYFLTDSSALIWSHFPHSDEENNYERWQLLDKPLSLVEFNALPKASDSFFDYGLSVRSRLTASPILFRIATEIKLGSHEPMRYKFKLFHSNQIENSALNHYVFCQLKEERLVGSFMVSPPVEGRFHLKIFGKPERELNSAEQDIQALLPPVVTFALDCTKARKYIEPYPLNELPWGPTQKFYDFRLKLLNQKGPTVVTWGGRRRLAFESFETMLFTVSLFDSESEELDTKDIIIRSDNGLKTTFTINPPRVGTFRFMLYGMPKPKQKGKWRLPLLASFMIDCKLTKIVIHDEETPLPLTAVLPLKIPDQTDAGGGKK